MGNPYLIFRYEAIGDAVFTYSLLTCGNALYMAEKDDDKPPKKFSVVAGTDTGDSGKLHAFLDEREKLTLDRATLDVLVKGITDGFPLPSMLAVSSTGGQIVNTLSSPFVRKHTTIIPVEQAEREYLADFLNSRVLGMGQTSVYEKQLLQSYKFHECTGHDLPTQFLVNCLNILKMPDLAQTVVQERQAAISRKHQDALGPEKGESGEISLRHHRRKSGNAQPLTEDLKKELQRLLDHSPDIPTLLENYHGVPPKAGSKVEPKDALENTAKWEREQLRDAIHRLPGKPAPHPVLVEHYRDHFGIGREAAIVKTEKLVDLFCAKFKIERDDRSPN